MYWYWTLRANTKLMTNLYIFKSIKSRNEWEIKRETKGEEENIILNHNYSVNFFYMKQNENEVWKVTIAVIKLI